MASSSLTSLSSILNLNQQHCINLPKRCSIMTVRFFTVNLSRTPTTAARIYFRRRAPCLPSASGFPHRISRSFSDCHPPTFTAGKFSETPSLHHFMCKSAAAAVTDAYVSDPQLDFLLATMFATAIRYIGRKPKPKMKPIQLKTPPEQTQTITRVIFDVLKEHGPLTIVDTWEHVKDVGLKGLTSKRHMKIVMRWIRERQKLRQLCNHVGPHKQFLYTTWFTKPDNRQARARNDDSTPKSS